jgi:hypothetical protein
MLILREERWYLKSEIMHISEFHLFEVFKGLVSEESYHPRFIGPFQVLERRGEVAYRLELPERLAGVHDVFHVSQLKKCSSDVRVGHLPLEELEVKDDLTYKEHLVKILDTSERATRSKVIRMCKVQWSHHSEDEATWEREDELKEEFPQLFSNLPESRDEILFKGVGFVTP